MSHLENTEWLGLLWRVGKVHPGVAGCENDSNGEGGHKASLGVLGAERAPALPKLPDDL